MSQYYPPYKSSSNNIKVELDLANYATKTDLKNITHVDVRSFASKTNLAALKTEVDKIDQKCMPRPKILDVNEGLGEALFYPYSVLVNKCRGTCDTLDNPMTKLCVPNVIKRVYMQVYNFLMMLNEIRNVLWHESCKCICKLNSSVSNNKQS